MLLKIQYVVCNSDEIMCDYVTFNCEPLKRNDGHLGTVFLVVKDVVGY